MGNVRENEATTWAQGVTNSGEPSPGSALRTTYRMDVTTLTHSGPWSDVNSGSLAGEVHDPAAPAVADASPGGEDFGADDGVSFVGRRKRDLPGVLAALPAFVNGFSTSLLRGVPLPSANPVAPANALARRGVPGLDDKLNDPNDVNMWAGAADGGAGDRSPPLTLALALALSNNGDGGPPAAATAAAAAMPLRTTDDTSDCREGCLEWEPPSSTDADVCAPTCCKESISRVCAQSTRMSTGGASDDAGVNSTKSRLPNTKSRASYASPPAMVRLLHRSTS